ncbi:MAG TPA: hypothetical protein VHU41_07985 [Thermoanaerobaculia bacterium]|nr:hypothetical protein [Thermoanaerobaculia bacterium]
MISQVWMLAAFGTLAIAAAIAILLVPVRRVETSDLWSRVYWGKFFVAIVYASIAVMCLVAMAHTAEAARMAHAHVHAVHAML